MAPHDAPNPESKVAPLPETVAGVLTWTDVIKWAGIVGPIIAMAFAGGVQLTGIEAAVAQVQRDVIEIKTTVKAHNDLPAHPIAHHRLNVLERRVEAKK